MRLPFQLGEYTLVAELGKGGVGSAFLARPNDALGLPAPIVVKVLADAFANDEVFVRRFRHEAEVASLVESPWLVRVFEIADAGGMLFMSMEYVAGFTLAQLLTRVAANRGRLPVPVVVELGRQILEGLEALHSARDRDGRHYGLVHRDVTPKNVMLGDDGRVRLIDLGLAKSNVRNWQTLPGKVLGSLGYISPEQLKQTQADHRADLYAVGVLLYESLALKRYIAKAATLDMLRQTMTRTYEPLPPLRPEVPEALDRLIRSAVSIDPSQRPESARVFARELVRSVSQKATSFDLEAQISAVFQAEKEARDASFAQLLGLRASGPTEPITRSLFVHRSVARSVSSARER